MGLLFAGIGFLCKAQPDLIAGYNTMSKEEKQNVDIEELSTLLRNGLIIIGGIIIICSVVLEIFNLEILNTIFPTPVIIIGVIILLNKCQKYDHNKKKKNVWVYLIISIIVCLFIIGMSLYGIIPTKTIFEGEKIQFTGMYGFELYVAEIESFEITDQIPAIKSRANGLSMGHTNKGTFRLESGGRCTLLLNSYQPPYLTVIKNNGEIIIINNEDKSLTEEIYNYIKSLKE